VLCVSVEAYRIWRRLLEFSIFVPSGFTRQSEVQGYIINGHLTRASLENNVFCAVTQVTRISTLRKEMSGECPQLILHTEVN
jgi:hypothetical protein